MRTRISQDWLDEELLIRARTAAAWGLYGSDDGAWYRRWEHEKSADNVETSAMAAIARFSCGESAEAWDLLSGLDLASVSDPYMRAMLCGVGAVIAFEVGASAGDGLCEVAALAAEERASHGASFFAGLARSSQAFVHGDASTSRTVLIETTEAVDGKGLLTLENMGLAGIAMTVGVILGERDPGELLVGLLDRYLEQHSLDPASVAMTLDVAVLHLDRNGLTVEAAMLLGLLDNLGLSMAILRGSRARVEKRVAENPELAQARLAGSERTTFEVLRAVRTALVGYEDRPVGRERRQP